MISFARLCLLISCLLATAGLQAQAVVPDPQTLNAAPVIVDGKQLFLLRGITSYPADERARAVRQRIIEAARNRELQVEDLRVEIGENLTSIMLGDRTIVALVDLDAEFEGVRLAVLADSYRNRIARAITEFREDRSRDRLLRNGLYAIGATIVIALVLWGVFWLYSRLHEWAERRLQKSMKQLESKTYQLFHAGQLWRFLSVGLQVVRLAVVIALSYFYLNAVLGLFPWTRPLAVTLLALILTPLRSLGAGALATLPDLFFLTVLYLVVRYILKAIRSFFEGVKKRRIRFPSFDADWAMPTYKIVRIVVIAFALVIAYPYIPGSDSLAFKGVSVFLGILVSLGSSSFIAHMIAGLTMTYRGAFKEGDVVRIGDIMGRVEDVKLMVTRIRTPKNETVILPNSNILNTDVVNYSTLAREEGLVLHTVVGIGYDAPWRQVEAMLLEAARRTPGLLQEPPPYVLQTGLGDFTVNYQLNAFCKTEHLMPRLYSALHANIQDAFNEHGVQIMSPHYEADPKSPKVVPPAEWYSAPATKPG